jgi:hypothetical protein
MKRTKRFLGRFLLAPFEVVGSLALTPEQEPEYDKSVAALAYVVSKYQIPVRRVILDPRATLAPLCGDADLDTREIRLIDRDAETALHEAAHIWSGDDHTYRWARKYLILCQSLGIKPLFTFQVVIAANESRERRRKRRASGIIRDAVATSPQQDAGESPVSGSPAPSLALFGRIESE